MQLGLEETGFVTKCHWRLKLTSGELTLSCLDDGLPAGLEAPRLEEVPKDSFKPFNEVI